MSILKQLIATAEQTNSEHSHQVALFAWFGEHRHLYPQTRWLFAIPNANSHHLVSEGVKGGVPDVALMLPVYPFHGLFVEMKIPAKGSKRAGVVSSAQELWHIQLKSQGYKVVVCYGWEDAKNTIVEYIAGAELNETGEAAKASERTFS